MKILFAPADPFRAATIPSRWSFPVAALIFCLVIESARALAPVSYSAAQNDRFSGGYTSSPVLNTSSSFLGSGYDFSGVGWASGDGTKSFGFLSPKHFLFAAHYGTASSISFFGGDSQIHSYGVQSQDYTNYGVVFSAGGVGDMGIGTLSTSIKGSDQVQSYAVLDSPSYTNAPVLLYGHGSTGTSSPRIGLSSFLGENITSAYSSFFVTSYPQAALEGGDSGSPGFIPWTDPTGTKQLTLIGNNAGIDSGTPKTYNYLNLISREENIDALNSVMVKDGYAIRWVADATTNWHPIGSSTLLSNSNNWSGGAIPSDTDYLGFSSTSQSVSSVNLGGNFQYIRGLIFKPGTNGFNISNGTLALDRGGLNNYDTHAQTIAASVLLTNHQFWNGHGGGFNVTGDVDTNYMLLVVQGSAASTISGAISGDGSFAKDGSGILTLSGSNSYTGPTFLHNGVLLAKNARGSATGTGPVTVEVGTLAGFGLISGSTSIASGAHLGGGNIVSGAFATPDLLTQSKNILTFGGDLTLNGALDFEIGSLSEIMGFTEVALSGSTSHLTLGNTSSFTLASSNFAGIGDPNSGLPFWNSSHVWTLIDVAGSEAISGTFASVSLGSWSQGNFSVSVNSGIGGNDVRLFYQATPAPEPSTALFVITGLALTNAFRRRGGREIRAAHGTR